MHEAGVLRALSLVQDMHLLGRVVVSAWTVHIDVYRPTMCGGRSHQGFMFAHQCFLLVCSFVKINLPVVKLYRYIFQKTDCGETSIVTGFVL